jgi:hypothetical protein
MPILRYEFEQADAELSAENLPHPPLRFIYIPTQMYFPAA